MPRILLIEDDQTMHAMLLQLLRKHGYEVVGAPDGEQGLRLFANQSFDLVITDIVMPNQEGLGTIRKIRQANPNLPIIAISGGGIIGPAQYLDIARKLGVRHAFAKPFESAPFLDAVRQCLTEKVPGDAPDKKPPSSPA